MKITKLGHCCLVIEEKGIRIMTDPGAWSTLQSEEKNINYIFITHEHQDHFHLESLKKVLENNPEANIVTNSAVGKLLAIEEIPYRVLEDGQSDDFSGIFVEGHGEKHAEIYKDFGQVQNTGYFFANRFFYPGDAFFNPDKSVEILALPVCGPWVKMSDVIEYAKALKPTLAFPVHDGMLKVIGPFHGVPQALLPSEGVTFIPLLEGETREF
ncbi:MAG: MBL fold metallo-hydrolase [Candidatus Taylorbacteria bacterium]|nr:MBL fold metallo-hydrolase [Candidatus Taylorbacteria bacterium]